MDQSKEKVLGMTWDAHADQIRFFPVLENVSWTKRGVLRQLARIFDPMGLLAAFLVRGKILMQELWRRGRDWDDPLQPDVKASWSTWFNQFADLPSIVIPRHVWVEVGKENIELHLFADAS